MSTSNDPDHFFQTSNSLAESTRKAKKSRNKHGSPIQLTSKILSVIADPSHADAIYVACSDGTARRLVLQSILAADRQTPTQTGETTHTYRGPTAPLTSLAISASSSSPTTTTTTTTTSPTLYASSWDKTIWSWDTATTRPLRRFQGHTDFVKCLLYLSLPLPPSPSRPPNSQANPRPEARDVLVSGSADASIIIWDVITTKRLHVLKSTTGPVTMRGVLAMAVDPATLPFPTPSSPKNKKEAGAGEGKVTFYTASSDPCIRRWYLSHDTRSAGEVTPDDGATGAVHETSVNDLCFVPGMEEEDKEMWTASSDGFAKCLVPRRSTSAIKTTTSEEQGGWDVDTSLHHGDYVRAVCVDEAGGWIVTAGRDEDVKVWDRGTGGLEVVLGGHFDEVTGLVVMGGRRVVSVGIDRTERELDELMDDDDR
ncbi:MAG: hypothetical protein OHK93_007184 [Ramalina farinacea]|uniref:WD40 repeat-like protein n=1 Tax=Ramalina farinacea TaxID=258253 RepID=A0AA43QJZ7_9LECA|nr:hypothetical protein [Ramalina farinacea]